MALRLSALLLLVPLIAGLSVENRRPSRTDRWPLMLVLDISSSMTARDLGSESRLSIVREEFKGLVAAIPSVPSGLVSFSGTAELLAPATREHDSLLEEISRVRPAAFGEDGTAIGGGLAAAVNALRRLPSGPARVLLVTDGINNRGPVSPLDAASLTGTLGVRIDVIGIGTSRPSRFLVPSADGTTLEVEALLEIDDSVLERVAERTGGRYWRARNRGELSSAFREYRSLLPVSEPSKGPDSTVAWTRCLAGAALLLVVLEVLLSELLVPEIPA
jgi:Ca-activated chloride channel homolog